MATFMFLPLSFYKERYTRMSDSENNPPMRELSFGEKAVGLTFNPSNSPVVDLIKKDYAQAIDRLNGWRERSSNPEVQRMLSKAITDTQTAQMWAVKAVTWQH
jgi:hypothetical protein